MNAVRFALTERENNYRYASRKWPRELLSLVLNRVAALLILCVFSPFMALIAAMIWKVDGSPIVFSHLRVGADGRLFRCFKFRSMRIDAEAILAELLETDPKAREEWSKTHKLTQDPRITGIGRLLRRTSLDELPQLLNVMRGDMNLVGPRPITLAELNRYGATRWHYLCVRPGMTGLWQVSGRNLTTYEERVELDRQYVERRSLMGDIYILTKTLRVVLLREGAC